MYNLLQFNLYWMRYVCKKLGIVVCACMCIFFRVGVSTEIFCSSPEQAHLLFPYWLVMSNLSNCKQQLDKGRTSLKYIVENFKDFFIFFLHSSKLRKRIKNNPLSKRKVKPECWLLQGFRGQMSKNYLDLKKRVKMYHL